MQLQRAVDDFIVYLAAERAYSPHTVKAYRTDCSSLLSYADAVGLGGAGDDVGDEGGSGSGSSSGVESLSLEFLRDWLWQGSLQGLSKTTLARRSATARSLTSWVKRQGLTPTDVGTRLKAPKTATTLPRVVTEPQMVEIFHSLDLRVDAEEPQGLRNRAIVELLYASGIRVSELVGLDISDIDLSRRTMRVMGKGLKERVVPFGAPAADALAGYVVERHSGALVLGARGSRLTTRAV